MSRLVRRKKGKKPHDLNLMCICVEDRLGKLHFRRYMKPGITYKIEEVPGEIEGKPTKYWITREGKIK